MSTNYYLFSKDDSWVKKYFKDGSGKALYDLTDEPSLSYIIHIGKRSGGWKPLFVSYPNAYMTIAHMKTFLEKHKDKYEIRDEYDKLLTIDELDSELIKWADGQVERNYKWTIFNGREELRPSDDDEYDIKTPFSHIEYDMQYCRKYGIGRTGYWNYYKDPEGYEFTNASFS